MGTERRWPIRQWDEYRQPNTCRGHNSKRVIERNNRHCITGYAGLALDGSGHVWAWGDNSHGELGTGNNTNTNLAAQVPSLSGITAVSAGPYQCCTRERRLSLVVGL